MPNSERFVPAIEAADADRLAVLASYGVLDTGPESGFDEIVSIAADVSLAPVALVSFVAADRQWFKARVGFEACETPLSQSVCAHALGEPDMLVVPDLSLDPRTRDNTLVTEDPKVRFYAGVVLRAPEGHALGTLCVLDTVPRLGGLTSRQTSALRALGRQVMALLELRRSILRGDADLAEKVHLLRERDAATASLNEQQFKLRLAIDATRMGIFDYDLVTGRLDWDARVRELFGVSAEDTLSYETSFLPGVHPDDRAATDRAVREALDPAGSGVFDHEYRTVAADDGRVRWIAAHGRTVQDKGRIVRFVGAIRDITLRRTADAEIEATLDRYTLIGRVTKDAIWDWDLLANHVLWNDALTVAYGYRLKDVVATPEWWLDRVHPDDVERVRTDIFRVINGVDRDWTHEYRFRRADGGYADVFDRGGMIRDQAGRPLRMIGAMFDNSARKAAEERQSLLNSELSHRMKNIVTMVQAIASQTIRGADSMETAQRTLSERLVAFSNAHDLLLSGASDAARLSEIVSEAVKPHVDRTERVSIAGPSVDVGSRSALPVMLMMHELATNAAKYGALSNAEGRIDVSWTVTGRTGEEIVRLVWAERGGPPVAPPTRTGFGTRLIERGLANQLGATVTLAYPPEGFSCVFAAPRPRLRDAG